MLRMKDPLVSIIIVVFNAENTLQQTLSSVISQTYQNWELIVIDGASTDNTLQILDHNCTHLSFCISEKDNGIYDAMNKGIQVAKGEWLYFLGSDDIFINERVLDKIFSGYTTTGSSFIYGNVRLKSNNVLLGGSRSYYQLIEKNISHQAIFYKREIFKKVGTYDLRYKILADYDLNLRIFRNAGIEKNYIPVDICLFNDKGGASNITIDSAFFADKLSGFLKQDKIPERDPALQQYYFYNGVVMLARDRKIEGIQYCIISFTSGSKKIFYVLVFIKFALSFFGLGKRVKIV